MLNPMRCLSFPLARRLAACAAAGLVSAAAGAQPVPGRDLLRFPLGTMDRPAAMPTMAGDGLGNPAAIALTGTDRARVGIAALQTPSDQGVRGALVAAAAQLPRRLTVGVSVARVTVSDLYRTESDPHSLGEIPYATTLYSATIARLNARRVLAGLAVRYRDGQLDRERRGAFGLDAGALVEHLPILDASFGAATFLWQPGGSGGTGDARGAGAVVNLAADLRILGRAQLRQLRAGYSLLADGRYREHFAFATARVGVWEGRAGLARADAYGQQPWRTRLGIVLHYEPYGVGVAREENGAGLGASYQFTLNASIR
jgi:hypothetical protein